MPVRYLKMLSAIKALIIMQLLFSEFAVYESVNPSTIEVYQYSNFPKDKVALHMPCEESNVFATKCMCHIRCTSTDCKNARSLCEKYQSSKGCRYMLVRTVGRSYVATLKRVPTEKELSRFDISDLPSTKQQLKTQSEWGSLTARNQRYKGPALRDLVEELGAQGTDLVHRIFSRNSTAKHCGQKYYARSPDYPDSTGLSAAKRSFLEQGVAVAALSYHAPKTLLNSMRSWNESGLADSAHERLALLNDPLPQESAIALQHGFRILEPKDIPGVQTSKDNVVTIGAAFYYALKNIKSEYLIFLENDFKMDTDMSRRDVLMQIIGAAGMLDSGIEIIRLMSRKYQGCGTFKTCDHHGIHLDATSPAERRRNWYAFYCRGRPGSRPHVSDCLSQPDFRCFTSWDSNWSLNAVMVKRSTMLNKKYATSKGDLKTIADIGLSQYKRQDGFESVMVGGVPWQRWRVPICISYQGLFLHEEIETST